jgi:hypothetical protein
MEFVSYRRRGDLKIAALGDDGKSYHFLNGENAANWMKDNTANIPTLASIAPVSVVAGAADATITFTGTNFSAACQVIRNGNTVYPSTYVSPTSITIVVHPQLIVPPFVEAYKVRKGLFDTVEKTLTYTVAEEEPETP